MTPMSPDLLLMLVKPGWSFDRVFSLAVQEIDGLKNAPTASGPTPSFAPEYRDFREAVKLLRVLQGDQLIDFAKSTSGTPKTRLWWFPTEAATFTLPTMFWIANQPSFCSQN